MYVRWRDKKGALHEKYFPESLEAREFYKNLKEAPKEMTHSEIGLLNLKYNEEWHFSAC